MLKEGKISYERLFILFFFNGPATTEIRKRNIVSEATLTALRSGNHIGGNVSTNALASLCAALDCQPKDIIEYIPNEELDDM